MEHGLKDSQILLRDQLGSYTLKDAEGFELQPCTEGRKVGHI